MVRPNADDVKAEVGADKVTLGRPGGPDTVIGRRFRRARDRRSEAVVRSRTSGARTSRKISSTQLDSLIGAASTADAEQLAQARLDLADFYMARGMYQEAARRAPT